MQAQKAADVNTPLAPPSCRGPLHRPARGEAELGVLPLSEILPVPGVEVAGTFPADMQDDSVMVAGVGTAAAHSAAARALIEFLTSPAALPVIQQKGMERASR